MTYWVRGAQNTILDARMEVEGTAAILHSRGGATGGAPPRNSEYQDALRLVCKRALDGPAQLQRILIDSRVAQEFPVTERVLFDRAEIVALGATDLPDVIGRRLAAWGTAPRTTGGNRTKRVRLEFDRDNLVTQLRLSPDGPSPAHVRVTSEQIRALLPAQLWDAAQALLDGTVEHDFSDITDYAVVLNDGRRLPPKAVVGVALTRALHRPVGWRAFPGGETTPAFAVLRDAGFTIVRQRAAPLVPPPADPPEEVAAILSDTELNDEDRRFAEGSKKRAWHLKTERSAALVKTKKAEFIAAHGRLFCEHCQDDHIGRFGDAAIASACFDAHHKAKTVARMAADHQSSTADLEILCATCHRAEHARMRADDKA